MGDGHAIAEAGAAQALAPQQRVQQFPRIELWAGLGHGLAGRFDGGPLGGGTRTVDTMTHWAKNGRQRLQDLSNVHFAATAGFASASH